MNLIVDPEDNPHYNDAKSKIKEDRSKIISPTPGEFKPTTFRLVGSRCPFFVRLHFL